MKKSFTQRNLRQKAKLKPHIAPSNFKLNAKEIAKCRSTFNLCDTKHRGTINIYELQDSMRALGQNVSQTDLQSLITYGVEQPAEEDIELFLSKIGIDFHDFIRLLEVLKEQYMNSDTDMDSLDAFVAMGGNSDKSGEISAAKLTKTIIDFGLTIDIEKLIREADTDNSGLIDFDEFSEMLNIQ